MVGISLQEGRRAENFEAGQLAVRAIVGGNTLRKVPARGRAGFEGRSSMYKASAWESYVILMVVALLHCDGRPSL